MAGSRACGLSPALIGEREIALPLRGVQRLAHHAVPQPFRLAPLRLLSRGLIGLTNVILPGKGLKQGPFVSEEEFLAMADDIRVVVGGTIPPRDIDPLKALGASAVFPMGTPLADIVIAFKAGSEVRP